MDSYLRYKEGRPIVTSQTEDEIMYYFYKLVDSSRRYSLRQCAEMFSISYQTVANRIYDISKKCEKDTNYLQYLKDTYGSFISMREAINHFSKLQPVNDEDSSDKDIISKLCLNVRDINHNISEIFTFIRHFSEILNKNNISLNCENQSTAKQGNTSI